jgi:hypothetical protein
VNSIWDAADVEKSIARIDKLTPDTRPLWGKMAVGQMLAHCCVSYEMAYEDKHRKPGAFLRLILKLLVKPPVVNETPYKRNSRTAPQFLIQETKDFAAEKSRLLGFIRKTRDLGEAHFDNKSYPSFGPMTAKEWNNMFAKHLDHHLQQFGV